MQITGVFLVQMPWHGVSDAYLFFVDTFSKKENTKSLLGCSRSCSASYPLGFLGLGTWCFLGHATSSAAHRDPPWCGCQLPIFQTAHFRIQTPSWKPCNLLFRWRWWGSCLAPPSSSKAQLESFMPSTCLVCSSKRCAWRELFAKTLPHVSRAVLRLTTDKLNLTWGNKNTFD